MVLFWHFLGHFVLSPPVARYIPFSVQSQAQAHYFWMFCMDAVCLCPVAPAAGAPLQTNLVCFCLILGFCSRFPLSVPAGHMYSNAQGQKGTTKKGVPIMYDIEDKINFAVFPGRLYLAIVIVVNSCRFGWCGRTTRVTRATHVAARAKQHNEAAASAPGMLFCFVLSLVRETACLSLACP